MTIKPSEVRALVLASLTAIGIGLMMTPGASAAPVGGASIRDAALATSSVLEVPCVRRRVCNRYGCRVVRRCW